MKLLLTDIQATFAALSIVAILVMTAGMMATDQSPHGWPRWFWNAAMAFGALALLLRIVLMAPGIR